VTYRNDDAGAPDVSGDSALQTDVLESLSSARRYNAWIADLILPHLGGRPLEIGSGHGDSAAHWLSHGVPTITVSDADPARFSHLKARFDGCTNVEVLRRFEATARCGEHSSVVAVNVLEHIEDDVATLVTARYCLAPGGKVIMFVPAFPVLMSKFDRHIGHFRRYRRGELESKFAAAGLVVTDIRYVNMLGFFAWFVVMRLGRSRPRDGFLLRIWDMLAVPAMRTVERRIRPPFGQSLLVVGRPI
jgi:hypothetical protein